MKQIESRQIRVFISSTFLDMKEERDYLVKFTFPQLRKLCESRGVVWGEVDLRWGVTDEQKAEGKVLPICLEEIKRCRPYFIGLLGERYGWIPDAIPPEVIEREPWLREHVHERKSVTELEILHGVLNNPDMAEHAFFYFRDPAYVESLPPSARKDFTVESVEDAKRLQDLKGRIRASGFPVREKYPDPKALGDLVMADLTAVIDKLFPEGSQPDPLDREAMDHEAYAQSRERVYIGRPEYFAKLDAYADGAGDQPLVILGESGCGKSALLANWVKHYREAHPDTLVLQHYIGATPYSGDWAAMLRRLMGEFKRHMEIHPDVPDKPDTLRSAFPNWLHMAAAKGRIVLVLDALNQLEDRDGAPDLVWLPPVMPENLRLIVSTLPGRPLDEIKKRAWPTLEVGPLSQAERERLIAEYLAQYAKALSPARVHRIAAAPQSANPLYLRVLLDELRLFGEHERLEERIGHYLQAESPRDLYRKVIARWEQDYGGGTTLVADTLSLLWAARRGLSETELLQALGKDSQPLPRAVWSPLYLAAGHALVNRLGLIGFSHDYLREAVQVTCVPGSKDKREAHEHLADYFDSQELSPRKLDELPWQLMKAGFWPRLRDLLTDATFFKSLWRAGKFDLKTYWARLEDQSIVMADAYRSILDSPASIQDSGYIWLVSLLLGDAGHLSEALALREDLVQHFRSQNDFERLQGCLSILGNSYHVRGRLKEAMAYYKEQEGICRKLHNWDSLQRCLCNQGHILHAWANWDRAMVLFKEQEDICRSLGNNKDLQAALGSQGLILYSRGDMDGAMALYKEQERICREQGLRDDLQVCLGNQGTVLSGRGDLDGAMHLYEQQERICREIGSKDGLQRSLGNQGTVLHSRWKLDEAMALYRETERMCRELENRHDLADCLGKQAGIHRDRNRLDAAMALLKKQEAIYRELEADDGLQRSLGSQGTVLRASGKLDEATRLYEEQERVCRRIGNQADLQACLGNQGNIHLDHGDLNRALALYKEQESICRSVGNRHGLQACLGNQGLVFDTCGCFSDAMDRYNEQEQICRELDDQDSLQTCLGNRGVILARSNDLDGAMKLYKEQEQVCRVIGNRNGLQGCLGNQGIIFYLRGQADSAISLYKEQENICREIGDIVGLARSLANQALSFGDQGRSSEGLRLAEEALAIATDHGYTVLVEQIRHIMGRLR